MPPLHTVKVAVVGTGLAGLTAAYLLSQPVERIDGDGDSPTTRFEVHLFEKMSDIGMDSSSLSIPIPESKADWRIDVPMRSFQGGYYPQLIAMYKRLGVAFRQADFSYSFSFLTQSTHEKKQRITTTMIYNGSSGRAGISKPAIFGSRATPRTKQQNMLSCLVQNAWGTHLFIVSTIRIFLCFLLTIWHSLPFWRSRTIQTMMFGDWIEAAAPRGTLARWTGMDVGWQNYVHTVFLPLISAMCTAPEDDVMKHPVEEILDYVWLTLGTHHYVACKGVREVVARLTCDLTHVHLSSTIEAIKPDALDSRLISIQSTGTDGSKLHYGFHHLVLATEASSAAPLLASYADSLPPDADLRREAIETQIQCLRSFQYRSTIVINHTDATLLPDDLRDRRDLNIIKSEWYRDFQSQMGTLCVPSSCTMTTHILPRPKDYPIHLPNVYQTTNPFVPPFKDSILSVASLKRAVLTPKGKEGLKGLCTRGRRRWWECPTQAKCELGHLQGAGRLGGRNIPGVWICGSFAYTGIPLLEGCVVSSRNVVEDGILKCEGMKLINAPWHS